jgi:protoporphyrinogen oxidase
MSSPPYKAIIIGAGPAGLTAAYELTKHAQPVLVLEADPLYVGGLSRTVNYRGYRFDVGGHRFFSKSREIEDLWTEILGPDLLRRPRSSRICYQGQFYSYPLKPFEALAKLGPLESIRCLLSFATARLHPTQNPKSFEGWVVNQFGRRLFEIFFKTYTEKVWGLSCQEISADWAAQRIKELSLGSAIKKGLLQKPHPQTPKTLLHTFRYPRLGPGQMWQTCAEKVRAQGGQILQGRTVSAMHHTVLGAPPSGYEAGSWGSLRIDPRATWHVAAQTPDGRLEHYQAEHLISSMPIRQLLPQIQPQLPEPVLRAAEFLRYRDFLTVGLILRERNRFPDNWIYIHDPSVLVGRIQNYKSWSPDMVPDPGHCAYGLEYFCFQGDSLWNTSDQDLIDLAKKELEQVHLADSTDVLDGCVIRQPKAYPVYDDHYKNHLQIIRHALAAHCPNLHLVGRNGMHKYNNQDHAMMTALLSARNILAGYPKYDPWSVNEDAQYLEPSQSL